MLALFRLTTGTSPTRLFSAVHEVTCEPPLGMKPACVRPSTSPCLRAPALTAVQPRTPTATMALRHFHGLCWCPPAFGLPAPVGQGVGNHHAEPDREHILICTEPAAAGKSRQETRASYHWSAPRFRRCFSSIERSRNAIHFSAGPSKEGADIAPDGTSALKRKLW